MQVFINERCLEPDEWTYDGKTLTIKPSVLPASGWVRIGISYDDPFHESLTAQLEAVPGRPRQRKDR